MEGALRSLASGEAPEQMLQVCEQDMDAADEAVSDLKGVGLLSGKWKREEELGDQPVRHSLWEQVWILQNVTFTIYILMETGKCQHGPMGQTSGSMTSSDQFPRAAHIVC